MERQGEPSATNEQHFPAMAVGIQEGEFMLANLSSISVYYCGFPLFITWVMLF